MSLFRRIVTFLFGPRITRLDRLLLKARPLGKVTIAEVDTENGSGWYVTIRPRELFGQPARAHRYTWSGQQTSMLEALEEALEEAEGFPEMRRIEGAPYAPKLGGEEFDKE